MDAETVQRCILVLETLMDKPGATAFTAPVDPEQWPEWYQIVQKPMDLGTVRAELDAGLYATAEDFGADVLVTFHNYIEHNDPKEDIVKLAHRFEAQTFRFLRTWLAVGGSALRCPPLPDLRRRAARARHRRSHPWRTPGTRSRWPSWTTTSATSAMTMRTPMRMLCCAHARLAAVSAVTAAALQLSLGPPQHRPPQSLLRRPQLSARVDPCFSSTLSYFLLTRRSSFSECESCDVLCHLKCLKPNQVCLALPPGSTVPSRHLPSPHRR